MNDVVYKLLPTLALRLGRFVEGGDKITNNIEQVLLRHDFTRARSVTYALTHHSQLFEDMFISKKKDGQPPPTTIPADGSTSTTTRRRRGKGARDTRENDPFRHEQGSHHN